MSLDLRTLAAPLRPFARGIGRTLRSLVGPKAPRGISREAVVWCYRLLLDREPESAAVVDEKLAQFSSLAELRGVFTGSEEFRRNAPPGLWRPALSGSEPPLPIEATGELERLFSHIQRAWEGLGETEPHWSVLTFGDFRAARIAETRERFYDTGRLSCETFARTLERNGVDRARLSSCLEYGCGVGRVTLWLARAFGTVLGCDISRSHLRLAGDELARRGVRNVTLRHLARPQDVAELPRADAIYSVIVLQHNPPPVIAFTVRQLIRALNPGGVAFFQVPTYRAGYRFSLEQYLQAEGRQEQMEMHVLPQRAVFEILHEEGARPLEVLEDDWTGMHAGERSNTFLALKEA